LILSLELTKEVEVYAGVTCYSRNSLSLFIWEEAVVVWNYGPERGAVIRVLEEQIRQAKIRLEAIGATADSQEVSFEKRDQADYGELSGEVKIMEQAFEMLSDEDDANDVMAMKKVLKILRRDIKK
jgi:hypothetical protein